MTLAEFALAIAILLGHVAVFVYVVNRLHAFALPQWLIKLFDLLWSTWGLAVPLAVGVLLLRATVTSSPLLPSGFWGQATLIYVAICIFAAVSAVFHRIHYLFVERPTKRLLANHTRQLDLVEQLGYRPAVGPLTRALGYLPWNEVYQLSIHCKQLHLPTLPPVLEGLTITHLSDLHMAGHMARAFYEEIVRQANELDSDLVVLTGDIVEKRHCLPWIQPTLGQLRARHGVYYVLGNHEQRLGDVVSIRRALDAAGLVGLGDRWLRRDIEGYPVILAGNELPWFPPAADLSECPEQFEGRRPLRILLSHSPDQLSWARSREIDLMLAGHTHGGQVRLPGIGPIFAPSREGIRHAAGTFFAEPTLMHVSRGLAGTRMVRLNCRPELAQLVLRRTQPTMSTEKLDV